MFQILLWYPWKGKKEYVPLRTADRCTELLQVLITKEMTLPTYKGEINAPVLGLSMQVFDDDGKPVVGEIGEIVLSKPVPNLPIGLWSDNDGSEYRKKYFSKYPASIADGSSVEAFRFVLFLAVYAVLA
ncbi:acetoacetyl-CoA synthetase [Trichonephila clavipes]|nr:acetoacetyl-CoA synthetase [Trichonephila clavipes]